MKSSDSARRPSDDVSAEAGALRRMYRITTAYDRPFEERLYDLLALGCRHLDVEAGFLTEITDGRQSIVEAVGDHPLLQPGNSCPLSKAYCRKTIRRDVALTVQHAAVEGWEGDTAYEEFGLESYIGAKVIVDGETYGSFCFADSTPRSEPFTEDEETFVELMAMWVGYELFQRAATERLRRQRDHLDDFASIVSHDLRNPINTLNGYVQLAEETGDPAHFEQCRRSLDRMTTLIDDLLSLARSGEAIAEPQLVGLGRLAREAWSVVDTGTATLVVDTEQSITADPGRVEQLLENLYRNSVEHGSTDNQSEADDSVTELTVRVGPLPDGFFVEDDGPGFPDDLGEEAFTAGCSSDPNGTGLGLAIVKEIAEGHGWTVRLAERPEGGARVELGGVETAG